MEEDQEHPGEMPGPGQLEGQRRRGSKSSRMTSFGSKGASPDTQSTGAVTPPWDESEPETPLSDDDYSGTPETTPLGSAAASPTEKVKGSSAGGRAPTLMMSSRRSEREHRLIGDSPMTPFAEGEDILSVKAELAALREHLAIKDDELEESLRLNDRMAEDMHAMEVELVATRGELAAEREKTGRWEGILASAREAMVKSASYRASVEQYELLQSRVQAAAATLESGQRSTASAVGALREGLDPLLLQQGAGTPASGASAVTPTGRSPDRSLEVEASIEAGLSQLQGAAAREASELQELLAAQTECDNHRSELVDVLTWELTACAAHSDSVEQTLAACRAWQQQTQARVLAQVRTDHLAAAFDAFALAAATPDEPADEPAADEDQGGAARRGREAAEEALRACQAEVEWLREEALLASERAAIETHRSGAAIVEMRRELDDMVALAIADSSHALPPPQSSPLDEALDSMAAAERVAREEAAAAEQRALDLQEECDALAGSVCQLEDARTRLEDEVRELRASAGAHEGWVVARDVSGESESEGLAVARHACETLEARLATSEVKRAVAEGEVAELTQLLAEVSATLQASVEEEARVAAGAAAAREVQTLGRQAADAALAESSAREQDARDQVDALTAAVDSIEAELRQSLDREIAKQESDGRERADEAESRAAERQAFADESKTLAAQVEEAREKSAAWVEESQALDASLAEDAAAEEVRHAAEKEELAAQVHEARDMAAARAEDAEAHAAESTNLAAQVAELRAECEQLKGVAEALKGEAELLRREGEALKREVEGVEKLASEKAALAQQVAALTEGKERAARLEAQAATSASEKEGSAQRAALVGGWEEEKAAVAREVEELREQVVEARAEARKERDTHEEEDVAHVLEMNHVLEEHRQELRDAEALFALERTELQSALVGVQADKAAVLQVLEGTRIKLGATEARFASTAGSAEEEATLALSGINTESQDLKGEVSRLMTQLSEAKLKHQKDTAQMVAAFEQGKAKVDADLAGSTAACAAAVEEASSMRGRLEEALLVGKILAEKIAGLEKEKEADGRGERGSAAGLSPESAEEKCGKLAQEVADVKAARRQELETHMTEMARERGRHKEERQQLVAAFEDGKRRVGLELAHARHGAPRTSESGIAADAASLEETGRVEQQRVAEVQRLQAEVAAAEERHSREVAATTEERSSDRTKWEEEKADLERQLDRALFDDTGAQREREPAVDQLRATAVSLEEQLSAAHASHAEKCDQLIQELGEILEKNKTERAALVAAFQEEKAGLERQVGQSSILGAEAMARDQELAHLTQQLAASETSLAHLAAEVKLDMLVMDESLVEAEGKVQEMATLVAKSLEEKAQQHRDFEQRTTALDADLAGSTAACAAAGEEASSMRRGLEEALLVAKILAEKIEGLEKEKEADGRGERGSAAQPEVDQLRATVVSLEEQLSAAHAEQAKKCDQLIQEHGEILEKNRTERAGLVASFGEEKAGLERQVGKLLFSAGARDQDLAQQLAASDASLSHDAAEHERDMQSKDEALREANVKLQEMAVRVESLEVQLSTAHASHAAKCDQHIQELGEILETHQTERAGLVAACAEEKSGLERQLDQALFDPAKASRGQESQDLREKLRACEIKMEEDTAERAKQEEEERGLLSSARGEVEHLKSTVCGLEEQLSAAHADHVKKCDQNIQEVGEILETRTDKLGEISEKNQMERAGLVAAFAEEKAGLDRQVGNMLFSADARNQELALLKQQLAASETSLAEHVADRERVPQVKDEALREADVKFQEMAARVESLEVQLSTAHASHAAKCDQHIQELGEILETHQAERAAMVAAFGEEKSGLERQLDQALFDPAKASRGQESQDLREKLRACEMEMEEDTAERAKQEEEERGLLSSARGEVEHLKSTVSGLEEQLSAAHADHAKKCDQHIQELGEILETNQTERAGLVAAFGEEKAVLERQVWEALCSAEAHDQDLSQLKQQRTASETSLAEHAAERETEMQSKDEALREADVKLQEMAVRIDSSEERLTSAHSEHAAKCDRHTQERGEMLETNQAERAAFEKELGKLVEKLRVSEVELLDAGSFLQAYAESLANLEAGKAEKADKTEKELAGLSEQLEKVRAVARESDAAFGEEKAGLAQALAEHEERARAAEAGREVANSEAGAREAAVEKRVEQERLRVEAVHREALAALEDQLREATAGMGEVEKLTEKLEEARGEAMVLRARADTVEAEAAVARFELAEVVAGQQTVASEADAARVAREVAHAETRDLLSGARGEVEHLRSTSSGLEEQLSEAHSDHAEKYEQHIQERGEILETNLAERAAFEKELGKLMENLRVCEVELLDTGSFLQAYAESLARLEAVKAEEEDQAAREVAGLTEQLEKVRAVARESDAAFGEEKAGLARALAEHEERARAAEAGREVANSEAGAREAAVERRVEQERLRVEAVHREALAALEDQLREATAGMGEVEKLTEKLEEARGEAMVLRARADTVEAEAAVARFELAEVVAGQQTVASEADAARVAREVAHAETRDLLSGARGEVEHLRSTVSSLCEKCDRHIQELGEIMEEKLADRAGLVAAFGEEKAVLERQLDQASEMRHKQNQDLAQGEVAVLREHLRSEAERFSQSVQELEAANVSLEKEMLAVREQLSTASAAREEAAAAATEKEALTSKVASLEELLRQTKEGTAALNEGSEEREGAPGLGWGEEEHAAVAREVEEFREQLDESLANEREAVDNVLEMNDALEEHRQELRDAEALFALERAKLQSALAEVQSGKAAALQVLEGTRIKLGATEARLSLEEELSAAHAENAAKCDQHIQELGGIREKNLADQAAMVAAFGEEKSGLEKQLDQALFDPAKASRGQESQDLRDKLRACEMKMEEDTAERARQEEEERGLLSSARGEVEHLKSTVCGLEEQLSAAHADHAEKCDQHIQELGVILETNQTERAGLVAAFGEEKVVLSRQMEEALCSADLKQQLAASETSLADHAAERETDMQSKDEALREADVKLQAMAARVESSEERLSSAHSEHAAKCDQHLQDFDEVSEKNQAERAGLVAAFAAEKAGFESEVRQLVEKLCVCEVELVDAAIFLEEYAESLARFEAGVAATKAGEADQTAREVAGLTEQLEKVRAEAREAAAALTEETAGLERAVVEQEERAAEAGREAAGREAGAREAEVERFVEQEGLTVEAAQLHREALAALEEARGEAMVLRARVDTVEAEAAVARSELAEAVARERAHPEALETDEMARGTMAAEADAARAAHEAAHAETLDLLSGARAEVETEKEAGRAWQEAVTREQDASRALEEALLQQEKASNAASQDALQRARAAGEEGDERASSAHREIDRVRQMLSRAVERVYGMGRGGALHDALQGWASLALLAREKRRLLEGREVAATLAACEEAVCAAALQAADTATAIQAEESERARDNERESAATARRITALADAESARDQLLAALSDLREREEHGRAAVVDLLTDSEHQRKRAETRATAAEGRVELLGQEVVALREELTRKSDEVDLQILDLSLVFGEHSQERERLLTNSLRLRADLEHAQNRQTRARAGVVAWSARAAEKRRTGAALHAWDSEAAACRADREEAQREEAVVEKMAGEGAAEVRRLVAEQEREAARVAGEHRTDVEQAAARHRMHLEDEAAHHCTRLEQVMHDHRRQMERVVGEHSEEMANINKERQAEMAVVEQEVARHTQERIELLAALVAAAESLRTLTAESEELAEAVEKENVKVAQVKADSASFRAECKRLQTLAGEQAAEEAARATEQAAEAERQGEALREARELLAAVMARTPPSPTPPAAAQATPDATRDTTPAQPPSASVPAPANQAASPKKALIARASPPAISITAHLPVSSPHEAASPRRASMLESVLEPGANASALLLPELRRAPGPQSSSARAGGSSGGAGRSGGGGRKRMTVEEQAAMLISSFGSPRGSLGGRSAFGARGADSSMGSEGERTVGERSGEWAASGAPESVMAQALRSLSSDHSSAQRDLSQAVLKALEIQSLPPPARAVALAALDPRVAGGTREALHARAVLRQLDPAAMVGALGRMAPAVAARLLEALAPSQRAAALVMARSEDNFPAVCEGLSRDSLAEALSKLGAEETDLISRRMHEHGNGGANARLNTTSGEEDVVQMAFV